MSKVNKLEILYKMSLTSYYGKNENWEAYSRYVNEGVLGSKNNITGPTTKKRGRIVMTNALGNLKENNIQKDEMDFIKSNKEMNSLIYKLSELSEFVYRNSEYSREFKNIKQELYNNKKENDEEKFKIFSNRINDFYKRVSFKEELKSENIFPEDVTIKYLKENLIGIDDQKIEQSILNQIDAFNNYKAGNCTMDQIPFYPFQAKMLKVFENKDLENIVRTMISINKQIKANEEFFNNPSLNEESKRNVLSQQKELMDKYIESDFSSMGTKDEFRKIYELQGKLNEISEPYIQKNNENFRDNLITLISDKSIIEEYNQMKESNNKKSRFSFFKRNSKQNEPKEIFDFLDRNQDVRKIIQEYHLDGQNNISESSKSEYDKYILGFIERENFNITDINYVKNLKEIVGENVRLIIKDERISSNLRKIDSIEKQMEENAVNFMNKTINKFGKETAKALLDRAEEMKTKGEMKKDQGTKGKDFIGQMGEAAKSFSKDRKVAMENETADNTLGNTDRGEINKDSFGRDVY